MGKTEAKDGDAVTPLSISFIHPDLGIGGAERLVVDAAVGLQKLGHKVTIYTSHHDPKHCFEETRDGTLAIKVYGDFLPRHLFGRFMIVFALLRNLYLSLYLLYLSIVTPVSQLGDVRHQVAIVDQISLSIPILRLVFPRVVFYCHFPDRLLTRRESWIKRAYRLPFDAVEEWTTGMADETMVNSEFTKGVFRSEFRTIKRAPIVLHPGIQTREGETADKLRPLDPTEPSELLKPFWFVSFVVDGFRYHPSHLWVPLFMYSNGTFLVSLNRFERKKDIGLAIKAFAEVLKRANPKLNTEKLRLFVAGGYDLRIHENVEHHRELQSLCDFHDLSHHTLAPFDVPAPPYRQPVFKGKPKDFARVVFVLSASNADRAHLLSHAACLLYTPSGEHFGIVPVEAMHAGTPVVAVNDGGPTETVVDGRTGFLRAGDAKAFAGAVEEVLGMGEGRRREMGEEARRRVLELFSLNSFARRLEGIVQGVPVRRKGLVEGVRVHGRWMGVAVGVVVAVGVAAVVTAVMQQLQVGDE
ncbi:Alpha-1,3-mannosyltransferase-like protein [Phlyctochytrium bullatum]|nr:Alpha-1,3-mannosyltransferase-like protein [Phlyctochytrium bullatum]